MSVHVSKSVSVHSCNSVPSVLIARGQRIALENSFDSSTLGCLSVLTKHLKYSLYLHELFNPLIQDNTYHKQNSLV